MKIKRLAVVLTLLLVSGCSGQRDATLSPQDEQALRIQQLIKALYDNSQKVRISATEELMEIGETALEQVKKALAKPSSREVQDRAKTIIEGIEHRIRFRYSHFKGGEVVCGLQATLRSEKDVYKVGEEIVFEIEVKNTDTKPRAFSLIWNRNLDRVFQEKIYAYVSMYQQGWTITKMVSLENAPEKLQAGEKFLQEVNIYKNLGRSAPLGEYEAQVEYYANSKSSDDLKSNIVCFKVEGEAEPEAER